MPLRKVTENGHLEKAINCHPKLKKLIENYLAALSKM
jgi:hypothetical protein